MKLQIPRELVLSRIAERIEFLEAEKKKAVEREEKIRAIEPETRQLMFAENRFDTQIAFLRFAVEHLPTGNVIETDTAEVLILGLHMPKADSGATVDCF